MQCSKGEYVGLPLSFQMNNIVTNTATVTSDGTTTTQTYHTTTIHEVYLAIVLSRGESVRVTVDSNAPVYLNVYRDNRSGYQPVFNGLQSLENERYYYGHLVDDMTNVTSVNQLVKANEGGLYIFELFVGQLTPPITATIDIQNATKPRLRAL